MNYEYRCLICDHTWESDSLGEDCPKCGEHNDIFIGETHESCDTCPYLGDDNICESPIDCLNQGAENGNNYNISSI